MTTKTWILAILGAGALVVLILFFAKNYTIQRQGAPQLINQVIRERDSLAVMYETCRAQKPDTIRDTIPGKPRLVYRDTGSAHWQYYPVDTSMPFPIECFYENHYADTLKDDTSAFVQVNSVVCGNELQEQYLIYQNRVTVPPCPPLQAVKPTWHYYLGMDAGLKVWGLKAGVQDKKGVIYTGGYDFNNQQPYIGLMYRLK